MNAPAKPTAQVHYRIPEVVRAAILEMARESGVSESGMVSTILAAAVRKWERERAK